MTTATNETATRYLTVSALARHLGKSRQTIHDWERRGLLPKRVRVGLRMEWFAPTIEAWERDRLEGRQ